MRQAPSSPGIPENAVPGTDPALSPDPVPVRLVFRPDARQLSRLKRIRFGLMLAAMVILGAAIIFILRYRPDVVLPPDAGPAAALPGMEPGSANAAAQAGEASRGPDTDLPESAGQDARGLALRARARVESLESLHRRSVELLSAAPYGPAAAMLAPDDLRTAQARLDSINAGLAELKLLSERLERNAAGLAAARRYDVSVVRDALDRARAEMELRQRELQRAADNFIQAAAAAGAGDAATAEVKAGVAASYRLQSERRNRAVERRAEVLRAAVRRLAERSAQ